MALLAEQIVEEWLARQGYFTIRGLKIENKEIDLLAIKNSGNEQWDKLHIEVQVSVRLVSYISSLTKKRQKEFQISGNAITRTDDQLKSTVEDWLKKNISTKRKKLLENNFQILRIGSIYSFME